MSPKIEWFEAKKSEIQSDILMTKGNENLTFQQQCLYELRSFCSEMILNHKSVINKEKWTSKATCIEELETSQEKIEQLLYGTKKCNFVFQSSFLEVKAMYIRYAISLFRSLDCL